MSDLIATLHSSESNEWYTPKRYLDMVREVFGGAIDLDPCSSEMANTTVRATTYYTKTQNSLNRTWYARNVFMNPPYGKSNGKSQAGIFCAYMIEQFAQGYFQEGIILVNSCTGAKWFRHLFRHPICFVDHRIRFDVPPGATKKIQPTKDNVFVYMGPLYSRFKRTFGEIGEVVFPLT